MDTINQSIKIGKLIMNELLPGVAGIGFDTNVETVICQICQTHVIRPLGIESICPKGHAIARTKVD